MRAPVPNVLPCTVSRGENVRLMRPDGSSICGFHKSGGSHAQAIVNAEATLTALTMHDSMRALVLEAARILDVIGDDATVAYRDERGSLVLTSSHGWQKRFAALFPETSQGSCQMGQEAAGTRTPARMVGALPAEAGLEGQPSVTPALTAKSGANVGEQGAVLPVDVTGGESAATHQAPRARQ